MVKHHYCFIARDQPNSRFHGRDIFREIGLPWKTPISVFPWNPWFFMNFNAFTVIYEGFRSFINSFFYADFAVCYMTHFSTK